jgi:hypothetical protein
MQALSRAQSRPVLWFTCRNTAFTVVCRTVGIAACTHVLTFTVTFGLGIFGNPYSVRRK